MDVMACLSDLVYGERDFLFGTPASKMERKLLAGCFSKGMRSALGNAEKCDRCNPSSQESIGFRDSNGERGGLEVDSSEWAQWLDSMFYNWDMKTDEVKAVDFPGILNSNVWDIDNRRVNQDIFRNKFLISTVFLVTWMSFGGGLFETMIFSNEREYDSLAFMRRYQTPAEAREGHALIVGISKKLLLRSPQISNKNYREVIEAL